MKYALNLLFTGYIDLLLRIRKSAYLLADRLLISPTNKYLVLWNLILSLAITFTAFSITIDLFFQQDWIEASSNHHILVGIQVICKYVLIFDIFIRLNTGFFQSGDIIMNRKSIFLNYLKTEFPRDVLGLCAILFEFDAIKKVHDGLLSSSIISFWNLYKLIFGVKLFTMKSIFDNYSYMIIHNEKLEGLLSLLKLFFHILFTAHIIACFWNFIAQFEKFVNLGSTTWLEKLNISDHSKWYHCYVFSIYWSLTTMITVGYGDIIPTNFMETVITIGAMIYGCGFFAYSINSIGTIIQKFDEKEKNFK